MIYITFSSLIALIQVSAMLCYMTLVINQSRLSIYKNQDYYWIHAPLSTRRSKTTLKIRI